MIKNLGTHVTHCCVVHGCKYGHENCPVASGEVKQEHQCEVCHDFPPLEMLLYCPECHYQHIDEPNPDIGWLDLPHKSHLCLNCGCIWRPSDVETRGVREIKTRGKADTWP